MKENKIQIKTESDQFEPARLFLIDKLKEYRVSEQMIKENELVFEEIFLRIMEQYSDEDMEIAISVVKSFGEVKIRIDFFGERFDIDFHSMKQYNPGAAILSNYEDKIGLTYRKRHNTISILARRTYDRMGFMCIVAMLLAIVSYSVAAIIFGGENLTQYYQKVILPVEMMFGNAMIMIASPVTFFSLVTNITNCYVIADNRIKLSRLALNVVISSTVAEFLAVGYFFFLRGAVGNENELSEGKIFLKDGSFSNTFLDTIYDLVPSNIFSPFMELSPFPMLVVAFVTAAAVCTMNKHFETIKELNDSINALFSRALSLIMLFLPAASFLAIADVLLFSGYPGLLEILLIILISLGGIALMLLLVGVRVAANGINPVVFFREWWPAAVENFKIYSSIDAAPYNIRFCNKAFGVGVSRLNMEIPILAQVNQTGNSFVIMLSTLIIMNYVDLDVNFTTLVLLSLLVTAISIGAPGQGGSLVIGLIIVFSFIGISMELVSVVIYLEALLGPTLPVLNSLFDITTVVINDKKAQMRG